MGAKGKSDREGGRERERKRERESSDMKAGYLTEFGGKSHVLSILQEYSSNWHMTNVWYSVCHFHLG